jgi:exodeoxyribonuclease VII large subunit
MQGEKAEWSIIEALDEIYEQSEEFDVVAILRGGGSQTDLSCFDSYELACNVAQFPLPIISGIGHEQDESVTDMVAWMRAKTPTAAAAYLIDEMHEFENSIDESLQTGLQYLQNIVSEHEQLLIEKLNSVQLYMTNALNVEHNKIQLLVFQIHAAINKKSAQSRYQITSLLSASSKACSRTLIANLLALSKFKKTLSTVTSKQIQLHSLAITNLEHIANLSDPQIILKKGFSLTFHDGKVVNSSKKLKPGDKIESKFHDGTVQSVISVS